MDKRAKQVRIPDLADLKKRGQKITMLTAYDATMARLLDRTGIDALLVGDSLGMAAVREALRQAWARCTRRMGSMVCKLLNIVQPDRAYFGEKDAQQLAVVRKMVVDLNIPAVIVPVATVREPDGLAMSSRNRRLDAGERRMAPALHQALPTAAARIAGEASVEEARGAALAALGAQPAIRVEYLEIVDPERMQAVKRIGGPVLIAAAVWIGAVRLIDNLLCLPGRGTVE
jgi:pantoate--beta-alanine ligase